jgi:hypothetical protein
MNIRLLSNEHEVNQKIVGGIFIYALWVLVPFGYSHCADKSALILENPLPTCGSYLMHIPYIKRLSTKSVDNLVINLS